LDSTLHDIRVNILTRQLNKIGLNTEEYLSIVNQYKSLCSENEAEEIEVILNLIAILYLRSEYHRGEFSQLIFKYKNIDELKIHFKKILALPDYPGLNFNKLNINNDTVYLFTLGYADNYIFWDSLLPGVYIISNFENTDEIAALSYYKHKMLFERYSSIIEKITPLKHISVYSSISKKFLPPDEYYLEYSVLPMSQHPTEKHNQQEYFYPYRIFFNQFIAAFGKRDHFVREVFELIKENTQVSNCVKAEILLALAGIKVSRLTMPKLLADNLHEIWDKIAPFCCASEFLVRTMDEGLGGFSNIPQGYVSYTNQKNICSENLIFIYVADCNTKASECAGLDAQDMAGESLGIPECCIRFYEQTKLSAGHLNPFASNIETGKSSIIPWQLNFYSMYHGNGLLWHFPCSENCSRTIQLVNQRYVYLRKIDSAFADTLKNGHFVPAYFEHGKYLGHEKPKDLSATFNIDWK
jgi:hypothetical protein